MSRGRACANRRNRRAQAHPRRIPPASGLGGDLEGDEARVHEGDCRCHGECSSQGRRELPGRFFKTESELMELTALVAQLGMHGFPEGVVDLSWFDTWFYVYWAWDLRPSNCLL